MTRQIRLGLFLYPCGHHIAAWRHPDVPADAATSLPYYLDLARKAEAARFDMIFMADGLGMRMHDMAAMQRIANRHVAQLEPLTLLSALAAHTSRVGLVSTASTSYNAPYHVARRFASLDQLSSGRAGWNVVTSISDAEAQNFNRDKHYTHADRYRRAEEFVDVVRGLWGSWDDDAFIRDKAAGVFYRPDAVHPLRHRGTHFSVDGPLNVGRSPQGQPVIVQAGASDDGVNLAARTADVVFTGHPTLAEGQAFYRELKRRAVSFGRRAEDIVVLLGVMPFVAETKAAAQAKVDELHALVDPIVALSQTSTFIGADLSKFPLDGPVPETLPATEGFKSQQKILLDMARRDGLTVRQLAQRMAGARGHWLLVGAPDEVADALEERVREGAADGFNLMPATLPGGLDDFIALVVPELRRRGALRTAYEGTTLREHLGLGDARGTAPPARGAPVVVPG